MKEKRSPRMKKVRISYEILTFFILGDRFSFIKNEQEWNFLHLTSCKDEHEERALSDISVLHLSTMHWEHPIVECEFSPKYYGHVSVLHGGAEMYSFGEEVLLFDLDQEMKTMNITKQFTDLSKFYNQECFSGTFPWNFDWILKIWPLWWRADPYLFRKASCRLVLRFVGCCLMIFLKA